MIYNRVTYSISGWHGIAGGISTQEEWSLWAQGKLKLGSALPDSHLEEIPPKFRRRLSVLGRCVISAYIQCLPLIDSEPAIIAVSRHGDMPLMVKLIDCVRNHEYISPTVFTYSVHNRLSSVISMFAGYRGVNAAYSSVRDGFLLGLSEAVSLIEDNPALQVLVVSYEPDIPKHYHSIIATPWIPHVAVFVLKKSDGNMPSFSLLQHSDNASNVLDSGSCLPLIRTIMKKENHRDGFWEHQYHE